MTATPKGRFEEVREAHPTELPKKATKLDFHCLINAPSITGARDSGQPRCVTQHNQWTMREDHRTVFQPDQDGVISAKGLVNEVLPR